MEQNAEIKINLINERDKHVKLLMTLTVSNLWTKKNQNWIQKIFALL